LKSILKLLDDLQQYLHKKAVCLHSDIISVGALIDGRELCNSEIQS